MKALQTAQQNFVITDPTLPDNPIVFASQGFLELTGYTLDQVCIYIFICFPVSLVSWYQITLVQIGFIQFTFNFTIPPHPPLCTYDVMVTHLCVCVFFCSFYILFHKAQALARWTRRFVVFTGQLAQESQTIYSTYEVHIMPPYTCILPAREAQRDPLPPPPPFPPYP